jgi:hypothetical protein
LQTEEAAGNLFTDIFEVQQVGSEGANIVQTKNKAILTLTTFAQARNWRLSYEMYASIHFAAFGLTVSQHLSKCYQHIFYEF